MDVVYVVTTGYYSDYTIVAIFEDGFEAIAFAEETNGPDFDQETDGNWDAYRVNEFKVGRP